MTRYTHILFDHDGVLVDTEPLYFAATRKKLAELGVELSLAHYLMLQASGTTAWGMAAELGASAAQIDAKKAERNQLYQQYLRHEPIDIAGVPEVLAQLRQHCAMAIVTTAKQQDFELIHYGATAESFDGALLQQDQRGIVSQMDFVLTNQDYQRSKPHPEPYLTALQRYDIDPAQALVVEDSERGLRAAVAAGIDCAVVDHEFTASQNFAAATYRISGLADLLTLIQT